MKYILIAIVVASLAVVGTVGYAISKDSNKKPPTAQQKPHEEHGDDHEHASPNLGPEVDLTSRSNITVDIKDFAYTDSNIKIRKGTIVTWVNQDETEHNVMHAHEGEEHAHSAPLPSQVKNDEFAGPLLKKGESYSFTFNETGEFPYHCAPHPNMQGKVTVVD